MPQQATLPFCVKPLEKKLVFPKPINTAPMDRVRELEADGRLIKTRKRDGFGSISVLGHHHHPSIYSLEVNDLTDKVPHLVEALGDTGVSGTTIIGAELTATRDGPDDLAYVQRVLKSNADRARAIQRDEGFLSMRLFNIIVADGEVITDEPFTQRLERLHALTEAAPQFLATVEVLELSLDDAIERVHRHNWEGLVLYDHDARTDFRLDGNIASRPRPIGSWKWKPFLEDDFVAISWRPSDAASHHGQVKDLVIGQYHPETGAFVECGKVGNLSKENRRRLMDDSLYPLVVEVKFERRFASGKLRSASIVRFRDDKHPEECILPLT